MKGQCKISQILFPLVLSTFIEQNIFFPETYNAFTISDPDFTVWDKNSEWSALDFRIISKLDSSFLLAVLSELLKFQL